ncbi:superoxide dismutase [Streptomyces sp. SID13031]|uniref:SMP-30/gluconolactonase/LRE family protein n=1 Tax=Streptomyces sp. SID13031 TaxID=2706046 RepID=UPI0013C6A117|nr:superoxide dismutase [Streptomyces sp. SID13031]NEA31231.1 superoxide dismutase [Streptomyces sp. SID13031]
MKKLIAAIAAGLAVVAGTSHAPVFAGGALPTTYVVSQDQGVLPESISVSRDGTMYVTSFGTGAVYRGNTRTPTMKPFLPAGSDGRTRAAGVEVDKRGRVYIAGYDTHTLFVYNPDGFLVAKRVAPNATAALNDLVVTDDAVYVTDSATGILWRASVDGSRIGSLTEWISPSQFPVTPGFLNGIVVTPDHRVALVGDGGTGSGEPGDAHLYRVSLRERQVSEVTVTGGYLTTPDGLLLEGNRLYATVNFPDGHGSWTYSVDLAVLNADLTSMQLVRRSGTAPRSQAPTAIARDGHRLLWVNSQFGGNPSTPPFTVTQVPAIS